MCQDKAIYSMLKCSLFLLCDISHMVNQHLRIVAKVRLTSLLIPLLTHSFKIVTCRKEIQIYSQAVIVFIYAETDAGTSLNQFHL